MREASEASGPGSPPRPSTIHSATLIQRVPRSASGQWRRIQAYLARVHIAVAGMPVRAEKSGSAAASSAASASPRVSYQAIDGTTGRSASSASTPVSAMLATPMPATVAAVQGASGRFERGLAAARRDRAPRPFGTVRQGVAARPWASSEPDASTTAALTAVVPTSNPRNMLSISPVPVCR